MGRLIFIFISITLSAPSFAVCGVEGAKITSIHRYFDGAIFVNFDKVNDCGCPQASRMAFYESKENFDFVKSMVLTAIAANKTVNAKSENNGCDIHGNTVDLDLLYLFP